MAIDRISSRKAKKERDEPMVWEEGREGKGREGRERKGRNLREAGRVAVRFACLLRQHGRKVVKEGTKEGTKLVMEGRKKRRKEGR